MDFDKIKLGIACAAFGAFALFGIGFGMSGWVLGGTAQQEKEAAVVERLAAICVAQVGQDPLKNQKIEEFKALAYDKRGEFVASQGWATMPGESEPNNRVAEKCGDQIG